MRTTIPLLFFLSLSDQDSTLISIWKLLQSKSMTCFFFFFCASSLVANVVRLNVHRNLELSKNDGDIRIVEMQEKCKHRGEDLRGREELGQRVHPTRPP